jgi:hypothetical protein
VGIKGRSFIMMRPKLLFAAAALAAGIALTGTAEAATVAPVKVQAKAVEAMSPIGDVHYRKWHRRHWRGNWAYRHHPRFYGYYGRRHHRYYRPYYYDPYYYDYGYYPYDYGYYPYRHRPGVRFYFGF